LKPAKAKVKIKKLKPAKAKVKIKKIKLVKTKIKSKKLKPAIVKIKHKKLKKTIKFSKKTKENLTSIEKEQKKERNKKNRKEKIVKAKIFLKHNILKPLKEKIIKTETKPSKLSKNGEIIQNGQTFFKTFVPGFDELVTPGLPQGSAILVEGGPGSGKTLWCLTLLREMCKRNKKVLYMSFEEPEERLRVHINSFGLNAQEYEKKGLLYLKRFNALDIARSVEALLSEAKKELLIEVQPVLIPREFQPDIIIIDSLSSISSAFSGESSRFRIYMEQLFRYLEGNKISSFLIREVASPTHIGGAYVEQGEAVSFLSDGIIAIYNVIDKTGDRKRALEILKMRGVHIERKICEYEITKQGVIVYPKRPLKGNYTLT
ncbi:MAG: ATPase domain-containing protein, partial [bacterium]